MLLGVIPVPPKGKAVQGLAEVLCRAAMATDNEARAHELTTTARALGDYAYGRGYERALYAHAQDQQPQVRTNSVPSERWVYGDAGVYVAINAEGQQVAELRLGTGDISPKQAIRLLYEILQKYEGTVPIEAIDDDDDDDSEAWKQGAGS